MKKLFDDKKFHVAFNKYLETINSKFLLGSIETKNVPLTKISLSIPIVFSDKEDYESLARSFWWLILDKILKHIPKRKYTIGDPLIKHENLYYFTPDISMVEMDKDYFIYIPFLKDTVYCKLENPIANLKKYIENMKLSNQKLSLDFPIYL